MQARGFVRAATIAVTGVRVRAWRGAAVSDLDCCLTTVPSSVVCEEAPSFKNKIQNTVLRRLRRSPLFQNESGPPTWYL